MCLEITATIAPGVTRVSARRLSELTGLVVTSQGGADGASLHFSAAGGCSCDLLHDDADFDSDVWLLDAQHLPALARAVEILGKDCGKFRFRARWLDGRESGSTTRTTATALAALIEVNRLGNGVEYATYGPWPA